MWYFFDVNIKLENLTVSIGLLLGFFCYEEFTSGLSVFRLYFTLVSELWTLTYFYMAIMFLADVEIISRRRLQWEGRSLGGGRRHSLSPSAPSLASELRTLKFFSTLTLVMSLVILGVWFIASVVSLSSTCTESTDLCQALVSEKEHF